MSIRMNDALRSRLQDEVIRLVHLPDIGRKEMDAYNIAAPLVRICVQAKYPPKDMLVCEKYGVATIDDCIHLQLTQGGVQAFKFVAGTGPLVVKKTYQGQIYLADQVTTLAVLDWIAVHEEHDEKLRALRNDYYALIKGARTLEEIVEIWPEIVTVERYARSYALTVLSQDVINRIKADVARRSEQAEET